MSKRDEPAAQPVQSMSGWVLEAILASNSPMAERLRARFPRQMLWRYSVGLEQPKVPNGVEIEEITGGSVFIKGWTIPAKARRRVPEEGPEAEAPGGEWSRAYIDIAGERARQVEKGRTSERDDARAPDGWLECLNLVLRKGHPARVLWVKVGSVAVAAIESIDRLAARAKGT